MFLGRTTIKAIRTITNENEEQSIVFHNQQRRKTPREIINEADSLEPMRLLRQERDKRLLATDWWAVSDRTITNAQKEYRQLLRDITINATPTILPNNKLNLDSINWPTKP